MPYKDRDRKLAYQREWYTVNRDRLLLKAKCYRESHIAAGLCRSCNNPLFPGYTKCLKCNISHNRGNTIYRNDAAVKERISVSAKEKRLQLAELGKCQYCRAPLIEGEGTKCYSCVANNHAITGSIGKRHTYKGGIL